MSILAIDSALLFGTTKNTDPITASEEKIDQKFKEMLAADEKAKKELEEVTKGGAQGYWEWKMKKLREQIEAKVMKDMNVTKEKLAAMSDEERGKIEKAIAEAVEQQLRLAMEEEMKRRRQSDLAIAASMQSIITSTQSIDGLVAFS